MHASGCIRLAVAAAALLPFGTAAAVGVELISRTDLAVAMDGNGNVRRIDAVTPDGRYTMFHSEASNLVTGDTNRSADLFLHDATTGAIERVSVGDAGLEAQGTAGEIGDISDDGRYVVFDSDARNLAAGANGRRQVYLRDRTSGTTTLLSRLGNGTVIAADSKNPRVSADGRYVVFDTTVVFQPGDTNAYRDVYRLDRQTGQFELISVSADGRLGNRESYEPQISADGSSVVFYTWASNLVPGDTNGLWDVLLRKPAAGTTQRVSRKVDGSELTVSFPLLPLADAISGDGRYVAVNAYEPLYAGDTNDNQDGYRYDSQNDSIERVTYAASGAEIEYAGISALSRDGQRIVMGTSSPDVVAGLARGNDRVFVRNLVSGENRHVWLREGAERIGDEAYGALISENGFVVALTSNSFFVAGDYNGMTDAYRKHETGGTVARVSRPSPDVVVAAADHDSGDWEQGYAASEDLRYVAFGSQAGNLVVGDTNYTGDVFVRDRLLGTTERVSVSSAGDEGYCGTGSNDLDISADGRYVVFQSCGALAPTASGFRMEIFRHDRLTHTTQMVSVTPQGTAANAFSTAPSMSDDGRHVAFASCATDLVADGPKTNCHVFVRDMQAGVTTLASRSHAGLGADQDTFVAKISGDGNTVVFMTAASNIVTGDTNGESDIFAFDRGTQSVARVSVSSTGAQADGSNHLRGVSRDGREVLFTSFATNFGVDTPFSGLFVHDRNSGTTELVSRNNAGEPLHGNLNTATISRDGRRIAFTSDGGNAGYGDGLKLVLFERDRARLSLLLPMDYYRGALGGLELDADGTHLLMASSDNRLVADDGNNHFVDVFLLDRLGDFLFDDGFETP